jgi:hypothetical protein
MRQVVPRREPDGGPAAGSQGVMGSPGSPPCSSPSSAAVPVDRQQVAGHVVSANVGAPGRGHGLGGVVQSDRDGTWSSVRALFSCGVGRVGSGEQPANAGAGWFSLRSGVAAGVVRLAWATWRIERDAAVGGGALGPGTVAGFDSVEGASACEVQILGVELCWWLLVFF